MYKIYNIEPPYVRCLSIKYLAPLFFPLWLADRHQSYDFLPYVFGRSLNILVCLRLSVVRTLWLMWNFITNTTTTDFNNPSLWLSRSTKFVQNLLYTDCYLTSNRCWKIETLYRCYAIWYIVNYKFLKLYIHYLIRNYIKGKHNNSKWFKHGANNG